MRDLVTFAFFGRSRRTLAAAPTDAAFDWIAADFDADDPRRRTGVSAANNAGSTSGPVGVQAEAIGAFDPCRPVDSFYLDIRGAHGNPVSIDPRGMLPYPTTPFCFGRWATSSVDISAELSLIDGAVLLQALLSDAWPHLAAIAGNRARNAGRGQVPPHDGADCSAAAGSSVSASDFSAGAMVCLSGSFR